MSGHQRHILVDTTGLLLTVRVHSAAIADRDGARELLGSLGTRFPRLATCWVDAAYQGRCATWITETLGWTVAVVRKPRR